MISLKLKWVKLCIFAINIRYFNQGPFQNSSTGDINTVFTLYLIVIFLVILWFWLNDTQLKHAS